MKCFKSTLNIQDFRENECILTLILQAFLSENKKKNFIVMNIPITVKYIIFSKQEREGGRERFIIKTGQEI